MRVLIVDDDEPFAHMLGELLVRLEPTFDCVATATANAARCEIKTATAPFDVLLLDQRLDGSDVDGVTLMQELQPLSPQSDAIILTGYDDPDSGLRAFETGAFRYLTKPFDTRELVHILRALEKTRRVRVERNWLQILAEIAVEMQSVSAVADVAEAIVRGGQRLGFERARLWRYSEETQDGEKTGQLIGLMQVGHAGLDQFQKLRIPLTEFPYYQKVLASKAPELFIGQSLGPGELDRRFPSIFRPPVGEWAALPLITDACLLGMLSLDNVEQPRTFSPEQRDLFRVFGAQAAGALARALRQEQDKRQAAEYKTLSEIGRQVTTQATRGKLEQLLDEVRNQVGLRLGLNASNFIVGLSDLETETLDFRRQYEDNQLVDRHWRAATAGLCGHVISRNQPCLIHDTKAFCEKHGITQYGRPAACWLGVPLRVENRPVGVMVVQDYQDEFAYGERQEQLLLRVAEQVAGAIQMAYQLERKAEQDRQFSIPRELSKVLPGLIQESEDNFWHAVLTAVTHRDGHSFNRAQLYWYNETGTFMQGRMGIGYFCREDARKAWVVDRDADRSLQEYLSRPHRARLEPTPLQQAITSWNLNIGGKGSPCYGVWSQAVRQDLSSAKLRGCLPDVLLDPPDLLDSAQSYACALVPVKSEDRVLGLLIVDNAFDGEPLRPGDLDRLEQLVEAVMRVWFQAIESSQARHLGASYEDTLALSRQITAKAAGRPLKESLEDLCRQAQVIAEADCVVIYPYRASGGGYDLERVTHVGLSKKEEFQAKTKNKPRQQGVTFSILQSGALVVPDVAKSDLSFGGRLLREHGFLQREGIRALIGVPMRTASTSEPLGVIYFDYRSPRRFAEQDIARAEHIATIGSTAITYSRLMEQETRGRTAAEASEQRRRRDMQLLSNIQAQALSPDSDEKKVIRAILQNASDLFGRSANVTLAILDWEPIDPEPRQIRYDYHLSPIGRLKKKRSAIYEGAIGETLRRAEPYLDSSTLAGSIRLGQQPIGALLLQRRSRKLVFDVVEKEIVEQLVTVAALALDNVRTRVYLQTVSKTVGAVSNPSGLEDTLRAVISEARHVAPDIGCVTLWYEDPDAGGKLVLGQDWGTKHAKHRGENAHTSRLVRGVMKRRTPIFATAAESEECLRGEFIRDENIASVAAFPLRFGNKPQAFGALFLNYRSTHEFTPMERTLFPIFANAAATAIHDEQAIDLARHMGKRLAAAVDVSTAVGASLDITEVLRLVLETLREEFKRDTDDEISPYLMLYNEDEDVLELPSVAREFYEIDNPEYQWRMRLPLEARGITCRVAREALIRGKILVENIGDVQDDPDYVEVNSKTRSELCAGLVSDGRLLGVLVIKSLRSRAFSIEDERLFELVAQQVAFAVDRVEQAAKLRFREAVSSVTTWAAELAHDINREVYSIRSRVYWLQTREANLSEQARAWAEEIDVGATRLADSARSARSDQRADIQTFNLDQMLLEGIRDLVARRWEDVIIQTEFGCSNREIRSYKERLWRSVRHLVRNAAEAMGGSGTLTVRTLCSDFEIEIQIEDSGPGVSDDLRDTLLRMPYTSKGSEDDRGYGLLIARSLAESIKGRIRLLPREPGRGAVFALTLPLLPVDSSATTDS